ncbi:MAG: hotdog fold thioesterase [Gammaproteobacteria bacterium]|nr:hotdog fold thioesterase [Gammaproteobacteria bacterium]
MSEVQRRVMDLAARDAFVRFLGAECVDAGSGMAVVRMTVGAQHVNFNGTCHGGVLFSLADSAFGLASNSHGRLAAAVDAHIGFTSPVRVGDVLHASAREIGRSNRIGTYRVDVRRDDDVVAAFTGTVYISSREHL